MFSSLQVNNLIHMLNNMYTDEGLRLSTTGKEFALHRADPTLVPSNTYGSTSTAMSDP